MIFLASGIPCFGEDYLVIKKKSGPTQRVPLNFSPDEIESFHVESAPGAPGQPGKAAPPAKQEEEEPAADQPPGGPMILKREPGAAPPPAAGLPARPPVREEALPLREPSRPPTAVRPPVEPKKAETPRAEARKPVSGPVAALTPGGKGTFTINVYKLPDNVKTLPDYSAFRPQGTVSADKIDLDPAKGEKQPSGLPENTEGLGMRCMGLFLVAGEGIFKWRVQSKDGMRLHIDDKTLIENDGIHDASSKTGYLHLSEGVHSIILDSFNSKGSPVLKLFVQTPLGQEQVFSIGQGLAGWKEPAKPYDVLWGQVFFVPKGKYAAAPPDFGQLSPIGRLIASELNVTGEGGIPGLPGRKDYVGVRYQGFFNVDGAGIFAFRLVADNFAKLVVGKDTIVEATKGLRGEPQGKLGWAFLQKGSYPVTVDYFHPEGEQALELYVTLPEGEEELFSPAKTLAGYPSDSGKTSLIPAFVYFVEPGTKKLPNFNKLTPSGMFFTKAIDYPVDRGSRSFPGVPQREDWLGLRFYVKFSLSEEEAGQYKFRVVARDAARLVIGKKLIVDAEGCGKVTDASGVVDLKAGSHEMFLDYFHATGPDGVQLYLTAPGGEERVFAFQ